MQDVLVLLQHLTENEETTIKLMIECLYDVGAVNFINNKVQNDSLNQLTKALAGMSKPIAKRYGYYWFKKNCPELIVNWLKRKVAFPDPKAKAVQQQKAAPKVEPASNTTEKQAPPLPQQQTVTEKDTLEESATPNPVDTASDIPDVMSADMDGTAAVTLGSPQNHQPNGMVLSADDLLAGPQRSVGEDSVDQHPATSPTNSIPSVSSAEIKAADPGIADSISKTSLGTVASAPCTSDLPIENPPSASLPISPDAQAMPPSTENTPLQSRYLKTQTKTLMDSFKVTALPTPMEQKINQIRRLKTQNKILMGSLAGTILVGGLAIWQLTTQPSALQLRQTTPSSIVPASQSVE